MGRTLSRPVFPKPVRWSIRPLLSGAGRTRTPSAPPTAGASAWPGRGTPAAPLLPDGPPGNPRCSAAGRRWYRPIPQRWNRLKRKGTPGLPRRGRPFPECARSPFGSNLLAQDSIFQYRGYRNVCHQSRHHCFILYDEGWRPKDASRLGIFKKPIRETNPGNQPGRLLRLKLRAKPGRRRRRLGKSPSVPLSKRGI